MSVPAHHSRQEECLSRPPYRQGRKSTAVKVYTVAQESQWLLIQGIPNVGAHQELARLFGQYGDIDQCRLLSDYPADKFCETYLIKFKKIQSARYAKKKLDDWSFFGGVLHVCYAPEYESVQETREKLQDRRKVVAAKTRQYAKDGTFSSTLTNTQQHTSGVSHGQDKQLLLGTYSVPSVSTHSVPSVSTHSVPSVSTHSVPSVSTHSVPSVFTHSIPNVSTHSIPSVSTHSVPSVSTHSVPSVSTHSVPSVSTHSVPSVFTHSIPNVSTHSVPSVSTHSVPSVSTHSVPSVSTHSVPSVFTHSIPNVSTHSINNESHSGDKKDIVSNSNYEIVCDNVDSTGYHPEQFLISHQRKQNSDKIEKSKNFMTETDLEEGTQMWIPLPPKVDPHAEVKKHSWKNYEFAWVPTANAPFPNDFDARLAPNSISNAFFGIKNDSKETRQEQATIEKSEAEIVCGTIAIKKDQVLIKDYKKPGLPPRFIPRQAQMISKKTGRDKEILDQKKEEDDLTKEIKKNAFILGAPQGPVAPDPTELEREEKKEKEQEKLMNELSSSIRKRVSQFSDVRLPKKKIAQSSATT